MTVRAKMSCQAITPLHTSNPGDASAEVRLFAVYGDGKANESWSKWTPQGQVSMVITNPDAIAAFELGKEYYLDFTPA